MLKRIRELLTVILLVCLPLHALLVTVGTKIILGPGFAPLPMLAFWKEGILGLILVIAFCEIIHGLITRKTSLKFDVLDLCILGLIVLSIAVTAFHWPVSIGRLALGIKYDFVPLVAFIVLRRVSWSDWFGLAIQLYVLVIGGLIALYGLATLILPDSFFRFLGYSDAHSLYIVNKPLSAFQQIAESGVRRIQSTFSGPNQLGLWLLLPWSFGVAWFVDRVLVTRYSLLDRIKQFFRRNEQRATSNVLRPFLFLLLIGSALFFSFSRSAWIGGFVIVVAVAAMSIPRKILWKVSAIAGASLIVLGIVVTLAFPKVFFRLSSSRGHIEHPIEAWHRMWASPLGEGLGVVGPASARGSDTCVMLRPQDDPSWAKSSPHLCIFLGDRQVQPEPTAYTCKCPWHPENWYLQIGVELGVIGFVLFILLIVLILRRFNAERRAQNAELSASLCTLHSALGLAFLGVSMGALFLHAWEDAAVAYSIWVILSTVLPAKAARS